MNLEASQLLRSPLLRFTLRRIALAVPTLLGIALVTFGLVHLAPGDPLAAGERGAPGGMRASGEAVRRLYFLDLPIFFNPKPMGLAGRVERLVVQLERDGGSGRAVTSARRCGTVCLPLLAWHLHNREEPLKSHISQVVKGIRADHPGLAPGADGLDSWLEAALPALDPEALTALTSKLGQAPGAPEELERRGTASIPALMEPVLDGDGAGAARKVAERLTGRQGGWGEWWYVSSREYVQFGNLERLLGHVTETRFAKWLGRLLTLRLGHSTRDGRPVTVKLGEALPVTLLLSLISLLLAYLFAVPLGVYGALRRGRMGERISTVILFILYSIPSFWLAMMVILLFGGVGFLSWFPIYGLASPGLEQAGGLTWLLDRAHHLVLPIFCLTAGSLAVISRYQRSAMLEVLGQDYVRTARAKGCKEGRVILRHALPNALLPTITLLGLQLPYLIGGSVIIERIFNIPGMGLLTFQAFLNRDYPVIMAVSVMAAALTLAGLILSDIVYVLADPRIAISPEGERA